MGLVKVKVQYGCYKGDVYVNASEDDDNDTIVARAKANLRKRGLLTLSMAYESYEVVSRDSEGE